MGTVCRAGENEEIGRVKADMEDDKVEEKKE